MGSFFRGPRIEAPPEPDPEEASRQAREVEERARASREDALRRNRLRSSRAQLSAPGIFSAFRSST